MPSISTWQSRQRAVDRELRVPAVVRDVDAVHQHAEIVERLQDGAALRRPRSSVPSTVMRRHQSSKLCGKGHFPCVTCASKSSRKWRSRPCTGHAAASANAQIVWPSILPATSSRMSRSSRRSRAALDALHDLVQPAGALAALRALAARLVAEEVGDHARRRAPCRWCRRSPSRRRCRASSCARAGTRSPSARRAATRAGSASTCRRESRPSPCGRAAARRRARRRSRRDACRAAARRDPGAARGPRRRRSSCRGSSRCRSL